MSDIRDRNKSFELVLGKRINVKTVGGGPTASNFFYSLRSPFGTPCRRAAHNAVYSNTAIRNKFWQNKFTAYFLVRLINFAKIASFSQSVLE
jgi:hypothetical protein